MGETIEQQLARLRSIGDVANMSVADRCRLMGIGLPDIAVPEPEPEHMAFARRLNHGPFHRVVRRRVAARRDEHDRLWWHGYFLWSDDGPDAPLFRAERLDRMRRLAGY